MFTVIENIACIGAHTSRRKNRKNKTRKENGEKKKEIFTDSIGYRGRNTALFALFYGCSKPC
jgi:hypothetical protein